MTFACNSNYYHSTIGNAYLISKSLGADEGVSIFVIFQDLAHNFEVVQQLFSFLISVLTAITTKFFK